MRTRIPCLALLFILFPLAAQAETGNTSYRSITDTTVHWPGWDQLARVLTLRDHNTRVVMVGTTILGLTAGMIGAFTLLRKRALMGDALSHATLPGIGIAFIVMTASGDSGKAATERRLAIRGAEADAARKRAGMVVPEAEGPGLSRWRGQMGTKHGEKRRFRLTRFARSGTLAPRGAINGKSPL